MTATNVKLVLVLDEEDGKEESLVKAVRKYMNSITGFVTRRLMARMISAQFMRRLHSLFVDCISNPFHETGARIESKYGVWLSMVDLYTASRRNLFQ